MPRYVHITAVAITILLLYLVWKYIMPEILVVVKYLFVLFIPFILAIVLAVLMEPMINIFHLRLKIKRSLSVALTMFIYIAGAGSLLAFLIFRLIAELSELSVSLPRYIKPVQEYIGHMMERGKLFYFRLPPAITDWLQEDMGVATDWASNLASQTANFLLYMAGAVPGAIMVIFIMLIAAYFISRDKKEITHFWLRYIPPPWGERTFEVGRQVIKAFLGYLRAQFILISITTLQSIIGLQIIGANYALTVGLLVGFFDLIPVLGPAAVYLPWAIWCFVTDNMSLGIKLLVLYAFVWAVRQTLEARVVAANLGLHPLAVLISMYTGLKTMGVTGLILGPILLITVLAAIKAVIETKKQI